MGDADVPAMAGTVEEKGKELAGGELEDESAYRTREFSELDGLVSEDVRQDVGSSVSGLYDLVGKFFISRQHCFLSYGWVNSDRDTQRRSGGRGALYWVCEEECFPCD